MNNNEKEMLSILIEGKEKYGYVGIKSEFEAEGSRMDELLRISEITRKSGLNMGIKIGGCEAVSDLYNCKLLGAEYIIAPMIETPYALSKYIDAKNKVFNESERNDVKFLFNLETISAFEKIDSIIEVGQKQNGVDGIVFGRVDFVGSLGFDRSKIVSDEILQYINPVAQKCKDHNLEFVVGGAVAKETISSVEEVRKTYLTRFETRKIIFDANILDSNNLNKALENAVKFELLWLKNKQDYYNNISVEDISRIEMLSDRIKSFGCE